MFTSAWPLLGREAEREAIDELVAAARDGLSGVLMLTGEPGIGKTRLLEYAAAAAADLRVIWLTGVESETQLGFGALHRLLRPFLDRVAGLPDPQRDALSAAFGLSGTDPPDRYLIGLATLTLLSGIAAEHPVVCLVDDVHWLDRESAEALAFTARRLHADALAFIFGGRAEASAQAAFAALPLRRLSGLEPPDGQALLALGVPGSLDPAVADRLVAGASGNPLALIELTVQFSPERLAGAASLPARLPVSRMLEAHFRAAISALPADARTLLLLIAAAPAEDAALIWRAAGTLGLTARAAGIAVERGILAREQRLAFRHPLLRSAVYAGADPGQRRQVHAALAVAYGSAGDGERSAWHRAEAAAAPDDEVAATLEAVVELGARDPRMAWDLLFGAMHAALIAREHVSGTTLADVAKATARAWHDPDAPDWTADLLMEGLARRVAEGHAQAAPVLRQALARLRASAGLRETGIPISVLVSFASDELWDIEALRELADRLAAADREQGALYALSHTLLVSAQGRSSQDGSPKLTRATPRPTISSPRLASRRPDRSTGSCCSPGPAARTSCAPPWPASPTSLTPWGSGTS